MIYKYALSLKKLCLSVLFLMQYNVIAMQMPTQKDPYERMRYREAFNQEDIYKKNRQLLMRLDCAHNVFQTDSDVHVDMQAGDVPGTPDYTVVDDLDQPVSQEELVAYKKACRAPLESARWWALAEPGKFALTEIALMTGGAAVAMKALGSDSLGGSFAGFAAIFDSLRMLRGAIQSGYNLYSRPDNVLEDLENYFAENQCFIPKAFWPTIIKSFMSARSNEYERETHTNFLKFALGLTTYKPKAAIRFKDDQVMEDVIGDLRTRIDTFFAQYNDQDNAALCWNLKINVEKFIRLLCGTIQAPRYIYLHGLGGIGKTHFTHELSNWIEELIPNSVQFEDLTIASAGELEGTEKRPGAFLRILRNQLVGNKRGSVIIMDEATWLNEPSMVSETKRVFNGDQSRLSTSYFGTSIDGTGIKLEIPPMLIFVASNEDIKDSALKSRFNITSYPTPSQELLLDYAQRFVDNSVILREACIPLTGEQILQWIRTNNIVNFREIQEKIEVFAMGAERHSAVPGAVSAATLNT